MDLDNLSKEQKLQLIEVLEEQDRRQRENQFSFAFPDHGPFARSNYPKQMEFFAAGAHFKERAFVAGNRTGKSYAGVFEMTCHLTGLYPEWWEGKRFTRPIVAWAAGKTNETVRDIIQEKFIGPIKTQYGEGMIPKHLFSSKPTTRPGIPDAVQDIFVRHVSGGTSKLTLKSYQQGRESFEGAAIDIIWMDEEPPMNVYTECLTRTATTKGIMLCTFTPLSGVTDVVMSFLPGGKFPEGGKVSDSKFVTNLTWSEEPPHLTEEERELLKGAYAPHELQARISGLPSVGSGKIYPIAEEDISVKPFKIPRHWPCFFGMDTGWHKTAVVFCALDPNSGTVYIYDEYYRGYAEPPVHVAAIKARGEWLYGAMDSAGTDQSTGQRIMHQYIQMGLNVVPADKSVDAGIMVVYNRMSSGKLKVFTTCSNWFNEFRLYRRDEHGRIVKKDDHLQDATRYALVTGIKAAQPMPDLDDGEFSSTLGPQVHMSDITGY